MLKWRAASDLYQPMPVEYAVKRYELSHLTSFKCSLKHCKLGHLTWVTFRTMLYLIGSCEGVHGLYKPMKKSIVLEFSSVFVFVRSVV